MREPKVSIIMPVYNGGRFFEEALQSALAQDYENIEIVVINDGSTDDGETGRIARRHKDRIVYIEQENTGTGGALNRGIRAMTGDIFCWLSHDDRFEPHKTSEQVEFYRKLDRPDAIVFSDYFLMNQDGDIYYRVALPHHEMVERPRLPVFRRYINGCTVFIPRHLLKGEGPFKAEYRYTQDYRLWAELQRSSTFFHLNKPLVHQRLHRGQGSHDAPALPEADQFWTTLVDQVPGPTRLSLFGSDRRFFREMAAFLEETSHLEAAESVRSRMEAPNDDVTVSVVIPFFNEIDLVLRALSTVTIQTHSNLEIILVDDGSTEDTGRLVAISEQDSRITLLRQPNQGPGSARNTGLSVSTGEYVAFLDADDMWLPHKVEVQLQAMREAGAFFSHTSYLVDLPERSLYSGLMRSGTFSGAAYPGILSGCPIATPTVMVHRRLLDRGMRFPPDGRLGEDVLTWVWCAQRVKVLGLQSALTVVGWELESAALNLEKSVRGHAHLYRTLRRDPFHRRWRDRLDRKRDACRQAVEALRQARRTGHARPVNEALVELAFGATKFSNAALTRQEELDAMSQLENLKTFSEWQAGRIRELEAFSEQAEMLSGRQAERIRELEAYSREQAVRIGEMELVSKGQTARIRELEAFSDGQTGRIRELENLSGQQIERVRELERWADELVARIKGLEDWAQELVALNRTSDGQPASEGDARGSGHV